MEVRMVERMVGLLEAMVLLMAPLEVMVALPTAPLQPTAVEEGMVERRQEAERWAW